VSRLVNVIAVLVVLTVLPAACGGSDGSSETTSTDTSAYYDLAYDYLTTQMNVVENAGEDPYAHSYGQGCWDAAYNPEWGFPQAGLDDERLVEWQSACDDALADLGID
jgi:hypothetical protein